MKSKKQPIQGQVKSKKMSTKQVKALRKNVFLVLIGGVIGFINGFFGGGGGMICVPTLQNITNLPPKKAHATALAVIFPITFVSSVLYVFNGFIESIPLLTVGVGVLAGGILGSFLLKWLPSKSVGIIFSVLMIVAGVRLVL